MDRRFLTIIGILVIIFIGVIAFSGHSNKSGGGSSAQPTSHIEGQGAKGVTLVEYGDYECPICGSFYAPLKQAITPLLPDIHFQFRNLPIVQIHKNAFAAARAAEAAGLQNKYWQMHDMLYEKQSDWGQSDNALALFTGYAKDLGLNVDQFKTDYSSDKVNQAINNDLNDFNKTRKEVATPTFFLDGQYLDNTSLIDSQTSTPSVEKITATIQAEIAKKNKQ